MHYDAVQNDWRQRLSLSLCIFTNGWMDGWMEIRKILRRHAGCHFYYTQSVILAYVLDNRV